MLRALEREPETREALLDEIAPAAVADAFGAARLDGRGLAYGALPAGVDAPAILERSREWF